MGSLGVLVLLVLALGCLVLPSQSLRINNKEANTFVAKLKTISYPQFKCCMVIAGTLPDSKKDAVLVRNKKCKQHMGENTKFKTFDKTSIQQGNECTTGKYLAEPHLELLKAETLEKEECQHVPWCDKISLPKCYRITDGGILPWYYEGNSFSQQQFPSGMAISVSGKICQLSESRGFPMTFAHPRPRWKAGASHKGLITSVQRFAKLNIKAAETLEKEECEGDMWKLHGLESAPECNNFGFWKQVLSTEGIKAPNWEASIAAANASSPEGMAWGTTMSDESADTLWNARRDSVLHIDDPLSSWS